MRGADDARFGIGEQHRAAIGASSTPMAMPGWSVTIASAFGRSPPNGPLTTTTSGEWIW